MNLDTYYTVVIAVMTGLFGLCVGSFLNVVIYRLPQGMSLANPPSHCTTCNYTLRWYDNIPVLSYLFLGGRCRKCREKISPRYIFVEIGNALLWLLCLWRFGTDSVADAVCAASAAVAMSVCVCIALIDLEQQIIFDRFQIILAVLGIAFAVFDPEASVWMHLIGAGLLGGVLWLIGFLVSRRVGREALGGGDIKFGFVAGLFLGWGKSILMMLIASIGAAIVIAVTKRKKNGEDGQAEFAFAPFLTLGFAVSLLFGTFIIHTYLHCLGME